MMSLFSTWQFNVVMYLITGVMFTQFYKLAVAKLEKDGAAPILLQTIAGIAVMLLAPFFSWRFPQDVRVYLLLMAASVFYAINDRLQATIRKNLPISEFSLLNQLSTVYMIMIGILFFKETPSVTKIIGAGLILSANAIVLYKKGKFEFNPSVLLSLIANSAIAIAISIDVGISQQFNLPFYIMLTLIIPTILIWTAERIPLPIIYSEIRKSTAKYYFLTGICWALLIIFMLRAYRFGPVTIVSPLSSTTVLFNVLIASVFFNERGNISKKLIAASLTILGVICTVT